MHLIFSGIRRNFIQFFMQSLHYVNPRYLSNSKRNKHTQLKQKIPNSEKKILKHNFNHPKTKIIFACSPFTKIRLIRNSSHSAKPVLINSINCLQIQFNCAQIA